MEKLPGTGKAEREKPLCLPAEWKSSGAAL